MKQEGEGGMLSIKPNIHLDWRRRQVAIHKRQNPRPLQRYASERRSESEIAGRPNTVLVRGWRLELHEQTCGG